jgi:hypothetical protein
MDGIAVVERSDGHLAFFANPDAISIKASGRKRGGWASLMYCPASQKSLVAAALSRSCRLTSIGVIVTSLVRRYHV